LIAPSLYSQQADGWQTDIAQGGAMHKDITMRSVTKFLLLLCLLLVGQTALAQSTGTVTYVYTDPQGTPLAEADASGNITATFDYTPYGSTALGTPPNGPGYTGHVNDPETNLVYMQARYYDPATGQFLSVDPITAVQGNVLDITKYGYAQGNPIANSDPDGRFPNPDQPRSWQDIDARCAVCLDTAQGAGPNPANAKNLPGVTVSAKAPAGEKTQVDIRYVPIGGQGYHHAFVVVTAPNGARFFIRGGPGGDNHGGFGQLLEDASASNGRSYGNLTVQWGMYVPGTIDYTTSPSAILPVLTTTDSPSDVVQKLVRFGEEVNASGIAYHPLSTNSNAFAHQAVTVLGVSRPEAKVWAPGNGTPLTVLNMDRP
jgi:RHS repeat-associated protein